MKKGKVKVLCGVLLMCLVISPVFAAEKATLYGVIERYPLSEAKIKAASEEYTEARLEMELLPAKAQRDKTRILLSAKSSELDVVFVNADTVAEFAPFLEPLNNYMKKYWNEYKLGDLLSSVVERVTIKGDVLGLVTDTNGHLLFYRKDLFDEAGLGIPKTVDEYLKAVRKLTTNERKGVALQLQRPMPLQNTYAYLLRSVGGDYFDKDWNPLFNNEKGVEAVELLKEFYKCAPEGSLDYWPDEVTNALNQDKAVTAINWISRCASMDNPKVSKVIGKMQFAVLPGKPPFKGSGLNNLGAWAISKFSKRKEEAFKLIAYLSSEESGMRFAHLAMCPRGTVLNNPELVKKYRWYPAASESIKQGNSFPRFPEFWEIGDELSIQIHRVLMGQVTANVGLDIAAQKAKVVLKEKGYIK